MSLQLWKPYINEVAAMSLMGFIPQFVSSDDPRSAQEQINDNYRHGGGWCPLRGWMFNPTDSTIQFSDEEGTDPPYTPVAETRIHDQRLIVYRDAWVALVKDDGTFEVARMD